MKYGFVVDNEVYEIHDLTQKKRVVVHDDRKFINPHAQVYIDAGWLPVVEPEIIAGQLLGKAVVYSDRIEYEVVTAEIDPHAEWLDALMTSDMELPRWAYEIAKSLPKPVNDKDHPTLYPMYIRKKNLLDNPA